MTEIHGGVRARLVALALLLAAPVLGVDLGDPAQAASAVTTQTIQLDPKVDGGGTTPRRASAAAARLAVRVDCTGTCASTYRVEVQRRPAGTGERWERVWSGTLVKGSDKVLRGGRCCEYRMRHRVGSAWQAWSAVESYRWTRTFVDEFSTGSLDPAKWAHRRPGQYNTASRGTCSRNSEDAVAFTSNTMKVSSLVDPDPEPPASYTQAQLDFCAAHGWYLDGMVGTANLHEDAYGWYSARVKMSRRQGAHTAFWLQHVSGYQSPGGEIDVAEYFGNAGSTPTSKMWHNCYWNWDGGAMETVKLGTSAAGSGLDVEAGERFWNTYNVYSLDWQPHRMRFLVNGSVVRTVQDPDFSGDGYMILSTQVRDYEIDKRDPAAAYVMDVDWVQAWQAA